MEPVELCAKLSDALNRGGVDLCHPTALHWYNESIPDELGARIPSRGAAGESALAVVIGNSRAIWEAFLEALGGSEELQEADSPLELYLERTVTSALAAAAPGLSHRIYWSHKRTEDLQPPASGGSASQHIAFQRMAHHSGLAYLDHDSHLCLHPRFGPWFSLRCVAIFDDIPYTVSKPAELPNPLPPATRLYLRMALHTAVHNTSRKFHLPEVDVEAAEAVIAETSTEPIELEEEEEGEEESGDEEEKQAGGALFGRSNGAGSARGSRPRSILSGGSTPSASSGCSSPRARASDVAPPPLQQLASSPKQVAALQQPASSPSKQVASAASLPVPCSTAAADEAPALQSVSLGSPALGSLGSLCARRGSLNKEGKPSFRAVAANWQAWVAVRDSPCPGHPMRYSEEQIEYHYTRNRLVLARALLRRNLGPTTPLLAATGLLDPALQSFHAATRHSQKTDVRRDYSTPAPLATDTPVAAVTAA